MDPLNPTRSKCCELGELAITWREANSFHGPVDEGWSMIVHVMSGFPEYANVDICPFCHAVFSTNLDKK